MNAVLGLKEFMKNVLVVHVHVISFVKCCESFDYIMCGVCVN